MVAEGGVVCLCLQTQIPDPQTAVPLGAVLEHMLHAVLQRFQAGAVNLLQVFRKSVHRLYRVHGYGGNGRQLRVFHDHLKLLGGIQRQHLQIAERIPPGEL